MSVTYTSLQNNRSSDANRKSLLGVNSNIVAEVSRATARETYLRENASETIASSIDSELLPNSTNPVQNKVITQELNKKESAAKALETVAYSGKYTDLTDRPTIPEPQNVDGILSQTSSNAVMNAVVTSAVNAKVPTSRTLATVARTGSYNDLTNKPTANTVFETSERLILLLDMVIEGRNEDCGTLEIKKFYHSGNNISAFDGAFYISQQNSSLGPGHYVSSYTTITKGNSWTATLRQAGVGVYVSEYSFRMYSNGNVYLSLKVTNVGVSTKTYTGYVSTTSLTPYLDMSVVIDKVSDMFPTSGNNLKCVCSHGTKMHLAIREIKAESIDAKRTQATNAISSIYSTIGTLT